MRTRKKEHGLTVNAVAGSYVVMLGLDIAKPQRKNLLGFAIKREDFAEGETYWLKGAKSFRSVDPSGGAGAQYSTHQHPIQGFQWSDYSAKPGRKYAYTVVPMYGTPAQLTDGDGVRVVVNTEPEFGARHSVFFNRGSVATQEYARRFENRKPADVPDGAAYRWLSRGLIEALVRFIGMAKNGSWSIHGAIYEFKWPAVLEAVKEARDRGVKIKVLFDDKDQRTGNRAAIAAAGVGNICQGRTNGALMHNKFFILAKNNKPLAVWTGSTNLTENGIFGHSNCGHVVEDAAVAKSYRAYWDKLATDPKLSTKLSDYKVWCGNHSPAPPSVFGNDPVTVFSPRKGLGALEWYALLAGKADKALFMTFPFGMHKLFKTIYDKNDSILRIALMEKEGNGAGLAQARIDIAALRRRPNVLVAIGNRIRTNAFDRWLSELDKITSNAHVYWIHTKYMLIDPLGANPTVVSGSANFSESSTNDNDENMLIVANDKRVADIYFGESLRLYAHYAFRESVARHLSRAAASTTGSRRISAKNPPGSATTSIRPTPARDSCAANISPAIDDQVISPARDRAQSA